MNIQKYLQIPLIDTIIVAMKSNPYKNVKKNPNLR